MTQKTARQSKNWTVRALGSAVALLFFGGCGGGGGGAASAQSGLGLQGSSAPGASSSATSSASVPIGTTVATYSIGGLVQGLNSGQTVTLLDNGGDPVVIRAAGNFTFPTRLPSGAKYAVSVGTQPSAQACSASQTSGTVGSANITGVQVVCGPLPVLAFVANAGGAGGNGGVSVYRVAPTDGSLISVGVPEVLESGAPTAIALNPFRPVLYVVNGQSNTVSSYTIDPATGALASLGAPVATGAAPRGIAVRGDAMFAYVANSGTNTLSIYSIDSSSGALTPDGSATVVSYPNQVTFSPDGTLFVAGGWGVQDYAVVATTGQLGARITDLGALTQAAAVVPAASVSMAVAINGKYLDTMALNPTTDVLSIGNTYSIAPGLQALAVDPSGNNAYMTASGGGLWGYQLHSAYNSATPFSGSPQSTGAGPTSITFNTAKGNMLYVTNSGDNTIWAYFFDSVSGSLATSSIGPFATATAPQAMVIRYP